MRVEQCSKHTYRIFGKDISREPSWDIVALDQPTVPPSAQDEGHRRVKSICSDTGKVEKLMLHMQSKGLYDSKGMQERYSAARGHGLGMALKPDLVKDKEKWHFSCLHPTHNRVVLSKTS